MGLALRFFVVFRLALHPLIETLNRFLDFYGLDFCRRHRMAGFIKALP